MILSSVPNVRNIFHENRLAEKRSTARYIFQLLHVFLHASKHSTGHNGDIGWPKCMKKMMITMMMMMMSLPHEMYGGS